MNDIPRYHEALSRYLTLKAQQPENPELPDPDVTRAEFELERLFKAAVNDGLGLNSRGGVSL